MGSTGSIGTQALEVIKELGEFEVISLSANSNIDLLYNQIVEFSPKIVSVGSIEKKRILQERLKNKKVDIKVGLEGMLEIARDDSDIILTSVVGMVGLIPTLEAIEKGKNIALANKETLVTAGEIVMKRAKEKNVRIIPVDSEHSAIYQCLNGESQNEIEKIILTASGGPFRGKNLDFLKKVSLKDALNHPNWSMGKKITVDSATLINKGLEVIEAKWLFDIDIKRIQPIIHKESIIHSMVEFQDGSIIAQMGAPNMKVPIQYALTEPKRKKSNTEKIDLLEIGRLSFEKPDLETFKGLKLSLQAIKDGGTYPAVLNAANEELVSLFLQEKIKFLEIQEKIEKILNKHKNTFNPKLEDILNADNWAREVIRKEFK